MGGPAPGLKSMSPGWAGHPAFLPPWVSPLLGVALHLRPHLVQLEYPHARQVNFVPGAHCAPFPQDATLVRERGRDWSNGATRSKKGFSAGGSLNLTS